MKKQEKALVPFGERGLSFYCISIKLMVLIIPFGMLGAAGTAFY